MESCPSGWGKIKRKGRREMVFPFLSILIGVSLMVVGLVAIHQRISGGFLFLAVGIVIFFYGFFQQLPALLGPLLKALGGLP